MPSEPVWDEALCRRYTEGIRKLARYDHRGVARRIARHLGGLRPKATVVEVASGPGFLAIELGRLWAEPTLVLVDSAKGMLGIAEEEAARARPRNARAYCPWLRARQRAPGRGEKRTEAASAAGTSRRKRLRP
jgi:ubiquinone/menaquinone biosynthesis C-methylase UbiE